MRPLGESSRSPRFLWVLSACLVLQPERPAPAQPLADADLAAFFDGRPSRYDPLRTLRRALVAPSAGEPAPLPDADISRAIAAGRWNNAVQASELSRRNPAPKSSFTFAVIGDAEPGRFPWERIFSPGKDAYRLLLRSIHGRSPDCIVQLGDFVSKGTQGNYARYMKFLGREAHLPFFSVIGNHDRSAPNGEANKDLYRAAFGETDFYFDYNGWRFVGLDTADRRLTSDQLEWLDSVLDIPSRKIVFTHVPPAFLKGKFKGSGPSESFPRGQGRPGAEPHGYWSDVFTGYFERGSSEFGRIMAGRRVERVYMGHVHAYGVAEHSGVRYVLTGGGGSPLYPLPPGEPQYKTAHYILVEAGPGPLRETVYELEGGSFPIPPQEPASTSFGPAFSGR